MVLANETEKLATAIDICQAVQYAKQHRQWVVIVCPDAQASMECIRQLVAVIPGDAMFSGRTAAFSTGGKVSLADAGEEIFIPASTPFLVDFLGWTSKHDTSRMQKWQSASKGNIRGTQTD